MQARQAESYVQPSKLVILLAPEQAAEAANMQALGAQGVCRKEAPIADLAALYPPSSCGLSPNLPGSEELKDHQVAQWAKWRNRFLNTAFPHGLPNGEGEATACRDRR